MFVSRPSLFRAKLLINISKYSLRYAPKQYIICSTTTNSGMLKKLKKVNLPVVSKMGVSSSAFKVVELSPVFYSGAKILDKNDRGHETFRLYHLEQSGTFEAVLYNPDESAVCFNVFRLEDERKAKETFR